jgi:3-hydroxyisobutyrate dehydrogenase-like beta-hydroxyacid dehydrogenase
MKVAFLGIGNMGRHIAANLLKARFDLTVWNRRDACWGNVEALVKQGAGCSEKIRDAVAGADFIGFSLASDEAVRAVVDEAGDALKRGAILFDTSTISTASVLELSARLSGRGVSYLDAPVSGGIQGAEDASLTVMVGGDEPAFAKCLPLLQAIGSTIVYMGASGAGQATKLINQMLTAVNSTVVCEAMVVAKKAGLDLRKVYDVLVKSWGGSRMLERSVLQYIIPERYESAACLEIMSKDLTHLIALARDVGYRVPLTELTKRFYDEARDGGMGKLDHTYLIEIMKDKNRIDPAAGKPDARK